MTAIFLFGCGILLMVGVGLVLYAKAIQREKEYAYRTSWVESRIKDAINKSNVTT